MLPQLARDSKAPARMDRLAWQGGLCVETFGVRVGIRTNRPDVFEGLGRYLPPGWRRVADPRVDRVYSLVLGESKPGPRHGHRLFVGDRKLAEVRQLEDALGCLESDLQLYVAEHAPEHVFVHAGVVGWQGKAVVIPGRSYTGKSTLVAALLRAGAVYYSDEYAVCDARGLVHPYARLLSLRQPAGQRPLRCGPDALGSRTGLLPLPVGLVLLTRYQPGAPWRPSVLSPGEAMLEVLNHTVPARRHPERVLTTLLKVIPPARVLRGVRGEADDMIRIIEQEAGRATHLPPGKICLG